MGRVIGTIVVLLVLYAIISAPAQAASTTREGASNLADAGSSVVVFLNSVVNNLAASTGSTTSSGQHVYPRGGVETGDGSTR